MLKDVTGLHFISIYKRFKNNYLIKKLGSVEDKFKGNHLNKISHQHKGDFQDINKTDLRRN